MGQELKISYIPIENIEPSDENPNEEDSSTFNNLVEGIERDGFVEPILIVPINPKEKEKSVEEQKFRIVGGEHRWRAAQVLGMDTVPCIVHWDWDDDKRKMYLVRLNILRGKLDPQKFTSLYDSLSEKYTEEVLTALMGFADEKAFQEVYKGVKDSVPDEIRDHLDKKKDEIQTVDDLAVILNELFQKYGDTLDKSFMVFTFGGREHIWIEMTDSLRRKINKIRRDAIEINMDLAELFDKHLQEAVFIDQEDNKDTELEFVNSMNSI